MNNKIVRWAVGLVVTLSSSLAWGAAGDLVTTVTAVPSSVSYNDGSDPTIVTSSIVFQVTVENKTGNTINFVHVVGKPSWDFTFRFASGANCQETTDPADGKRVIDCDLGKFGGLRSATFYLTFIAPPTGPNVSLSGITSYAEGGNGQNPQPNSVVPFGPVGVTLGAATSTSVSSAVPAGLAKQKFKTGANTVDALLSDQIQTTVDVRDAPTIFNTLFVTEAPATAIAADDVGCNAQGNFNRCYLSTIDLLQAGSGVPYQTPAGQYLYFTFRMEPAAVKKGFQARNVRVYHDGDYSNPIPNCTVISASGKPVVYETVPCLDLANVVYYKRTTAAGPEGAADIPVVANRNGIWAIR